MALLDTTLLYHGSTPLYFTLHNSHRLYLTLIVSTFLYQGYTWPYITLPVLYFTLLESNAFYNTSTWLYVTLHYSTMALLTSFYLTLHYSTIALLDSSWLNLLYSNIALHHSTSLYQGFTSTLLGSTLLYSTMPLLHSTSLYITLQWLHCTVLESPSFTMTLLPLYFTLHYSVINIGSILESTCVHFTLATKALVNSTDSVVHSTILYHGSSSSTLLCSTMALHHSTGLHHPVAFILLDSTLSSTSLYVTLLYHVSPSHYFILLHHSTMALLDSTWL